MEKVKKYKVYKILIEHPVYLGLVDRSFSSDSKNVEI